MTADIETIKAAIKKRRPLVRRNGLPPWTPIDPALTSVLVASTDKHPPLWIGRLWTRAFLVTESFGRTFFSRLVRAATLAVVTALALVLLAGEATPMAALSEASVQIQSLQLSIAIGSLIFGGDFIAALLWSKRHGVWYGNEFVFDAPKQVLPIRVSAADNEKAFVVPTQVALPGAFVNFTVAIERDDTRVIAEVHSSPSKPTLSFAKNRRHGIRLSSRGRIYLTAQCAAEATPTMVRVHIKTILYGHDATYAKIENL